MAQKVFVTKDRHSVLAAEFFKELYEKYPELRIYTIAEIKKFIKDFNGVIRKQVTTTREGVELPVYLGFMFLGTYGIRKPPIKFSEVNEKGEHVRLPHPHHSDGFGGMVYYVTDPVKKRFTNSKYWGFTPCSEFNKQVGNAYRTEWKKFIHIGTGRRTVSSVLRNAKAKDFAMKSKKDIVDNYNEFAFD